MYEADDYRRIEIIIRDKLPELLKQTKVVLERCR